MVKPQLKPESCAQDDLAMPAVNLSNRLNPNNIHYDRELAARYKRMSKPEKEALWARDREMQKQKVGFRICLCITSCLTPFHEAHVDA